MSAICNCTQADIDRSGPGEPWCRKMQGMVESGVW